MKSDEFKKVLQREYSKILGRKVGKAVCWEILKATMGAIIQCAVANRTDRSLGLSGIGQFYVHMVKPRQRKNEAGVLQPSKYEEAGLEYVPTFKWMPAERIKQYLLSSILSYKSDGGKVVPLTIQERELVEQGISEIDVDLRPKDSPQRIKRRLNAEAKKLRDLERQRAAQEKHHKALEAAAQRMIGDRADGTDTKTEPIQAKPVTTEGEGVQHE